MANRVYCTYFDHNYLPRGLALYHSLQRHAPGARLWVLCLSEACHRALLALDLPNLLAVRMADFEAANADVAATRSSRSQIEYYFTCSPAWILFVLESNPDAEWATYLDSDLFFFASPDPIYEEMKDAAFGIIPHRFSRGLEGQRRFGLYNVGWVSVRRRDDGIAALRWWRERCIEWCYDRVEGDRFADQRYLDRLPEMFGGVHVISHLGANLAPWNFADYHLEWNDGRGRDRAAIQAAVLSFFRGQTQRRVLFQQPPAVSCAVFQPDEAQTIRAIHGGTRRSGTGGGASLLKEQQIETIRKPVVTTPGRPPVQCVRGR